MKLHWGNAIFLFFVVFISLAIFFIVFSLRQNNDLVSDTYYKDGADFTTQMETNQRSLMYTDSIWVIIYDSYVELNACGSIQTLNVPIQAWFFRPSAKEDDLKTIWKNPTKPLQIENKNLAKGRYLVRLRWEMNGDSYFIQKDVFIK